jgi:hypothetical protein
MIVNFLFCVALERAVVPHTAENDEILINVVAHPRMPQAL